MKTFLYILFFSTIGILSYAQENLEIKKIRIKGQDAISRMNIKDQLSLETTSWFKQKIRKKNPVLFSYSQYESDIQRLKKQYQKEGYLNVVFEKPEISIDKKQKLHLTITVKEGRPTLVSSINYLIDSAFTLSQFLPKQGTKAIIFGSKLRVSDHFNDQDFFSDRLLISDAFHNVGYPYSTVDYKLSVDTLTHKVGINWYVTKGKIARFGATTISGNSKVPEKSIRKILAYEPGDIWSKKQLDRTQKQIYNQGMYRVASVKAEMEENQPDTIPVHIQIEEAPVWTTRFGGGYGREDKFRAFTELQYLGFITHTGRLNFYAKHSALEPYHVYLRFSQPSLFFPINTLLVHPYIQRKHEPGYWMFRKGYNLSMLQNFSKQLNTYIGFEFEDVSVDTSRIAKPESQAVSFDYDLQESNYKKSGTALGVMYNNADPILDPIQGYSASLNFKNNGLVGTHKYPFFRLLAEYKKYIALKNGVVLALKGKIGGVQPGKNTNFIPVEERFFAGGGTSVRGWARHDLGPKDIAGRPIGGNSLLEASTEFRYYANKYLVLSAFADAGNVWEKPFSYKMNELHFAAGAGIKVKTPIGPAGIDFARPVFEENRKWQIHFSIGHSF